MWGSGTAGYLKLRGCMEMITSSLKYELQGLLCGGEDSSAEAEGSTESWSIMITDTQKNVMITKKRLESI